MGRGGGGGKAKLRLPGGKLVGGVVAFAAVFAAGVFFGDSIPVQRDYLPELVASLAVLAALVVIVGVDKFVLFSALAGAAALVITMSPDVQAVATSAYDGAYAAAHQAPTCQKGYRNVPPSNKCQKVRSGR